MEENKMLKCDFCDESFSDEETLSQHILSIHKSIIEGKKKCDFCDKMYFSKYSLLAHVKTSHANAESYQCDETTLK